MLIYTYAKVQIFSHFCILMKKNRYRVFTVLLTLASLAWSAEARMTPEQYIEKYKGIAIQEMKKHGIPASITLAQGGLESGWGSSELAVKANNHFGIKCHGWQGATYRKDAEIPKECFRKYDSPEQSYRDHSDFLRYRDRYSFLFSLKSTDYKGWANGLLAAGYATNKNYPALLIGIIEKYGLDKYDRAGSSSTRKEAPEIGINNGIRFIVACSTDTYSDLAKKYHIYKSDLIRYNEVSSKTDRPKPGSKVYLDWKKPKARKNCLTHKAAAGESYYDISQIYGIKIKSLYRLNDAKEGDSPAPGQTVYLRKKKRK